MKINLNKKEDTLYVAEVGRIYTTNNRILYIVNRYRVIYYNKNQVVIKIHRGKLGLRNITKYFSPFSDVITYDAFIQHFEYYKTNLHEKNSLDFHRVLVPKEKYNVFKSLIKEMGSLDPKIALFNSLKESVQIFNVNSERFSFYKEEIKNLAKELEKGKKEAIKTTEAIKLYFEKDKIPDEIEQYIKTNVCPILEEE